MGDNGGQVISTEEAMLASLIVVNEEFQKMVCKECKLAVGLGMVGTHLSKRHGVKRDMAQRIANLVDMGEWGCVEVSGKETKKPKNGTRPQEWLVVFDGLQCKFCREFQARSVGEVESHWYGAGHGKAEGAMIETVRMQSWGGWAGRDGKDKDIWVVEEGLGGGSNDGQIGVEGSEDCKVAVRWREWRGGSRGRSTERGSGVKGLVVGEQRHGDDTRMTRRGRAFEVMKTRLSAGCKPVV